MAALAQDDAPWPAAVAVSGGGDSLALMLLLAEWARSRKKPTPVVLTVDHGLRTGSARDADAVVVAAKAAGLQAHTLKWRGPKPKSDLEAAAREVRYRLMGAWCRRHGTQNLYVAHTLEDQAETFLLRLARGSGLDGLAAMQALAPFPVPGFEGLTVIRPLLGSTRAELRAFLESRGLEWAEDPMNSDPRFARARLRAAWPALDAAGLTARRIAAASGHLARARGALDTATAAFLKDHVRPVADGAVVDGAALGELPREVGLRVLAALLGRVSGAAYRPRFERLERLYGAILAGELGRGRTLHGCRIGPAPKRRAVFGGSGLLIAREAGRAPRTGRARAAKGGLTRKGRKGRDNGSARSERDD
jgi:tRNA(Ile)-lysidine synthase